MIEQLKALVRVCDDEECELVERLLYAAVSYVHAVTVQQITKQNISQLRGEALRNAVEESDKNRRSCHDTLIVCVDIVNRLCHAHEQPPIYCGSTNRREYGDFAGMLVHEIFQNR